MNTIYQMKLRTTICVLSAALLSLAGCTSDPYETASGPGSGDTTGIRLNFVQNDSWGVAQTETRTTETVVEEGVDNVWVFQFNGTGDDALLVTPQRYTTESTSPFALANGGGTQQFIAVVANTGASDYQWGMEAGQSTLADLKKAMYAISGETDLFPDGKLILFGSLTLYTDGRTNAATVNMVHTMARVKLSLTNNATDLVIKGVQMCNVPNRMAFAGPAMALTAPFPTQGTVDHIDYDVESTDIIKNESGSFMFYVTPNLRGTVVNDNPKLKKGFAPYDASYVKVIAMDTSDGKNSLVEYRFYPGENMTNDFNVRINHSYEISVSITGKDDYSVDGRIEDKGIISFAGRPANSYILNPPAIGSVSYRVYVARADVFWGPGYANHPDKMLGMTGAWEAELLWMNTLGLLSRSDANKIRVTKSSGLGINDYFEITVPSTALHGNFTMKIYKADDAEKSALWSWHFWVTDYNPDISGLTPHERTHAYEVTGGQVHRYAGDSWETGTYANSFMMDRNLGQLEVDPDFNYTYDGYSVTPGQNSILYYQWGRKDPFPCGHYSQTSKSNIAFDIDGNKMGIPIIHPLSGAAANCVDWQTVAVSSPNSAIYSYTLSHYGEDTHWGDHTLVRDEDKSLFDPCPPGWNLPMANAFEDFRVTTTLNAARGMSYRNGFQYWPMVEVDGSYPVQGVIHFPAMGYSHYNKVGDTDFTALFHATGHEESPKYIRVQFLYATNTTINPKANPSSSYHANTPMPVRCISEQ